MFEQPERLLLALVAIYVVEELEGRLSAPTKEETGKGVRRRPIEDFGDFRPELLLLDAILEGVDAGDDEAVELLVANVSKGAVEFANMVGGRVARVTPCGDAANIRVCRHEGQVHLQHRIAEPQGKLPLGRNLVRHEIDNGDLERTDVLSFRPAPVDRERAAQRRQEGMDLLAVDNDGHDERSLRTHLCDAEAPG